MNRLLEEIIQSIARELYAAGGLVSYSLTTGFVLILLRLYGAPITIPVSLICLAPSLGIFYYRLKEYDKVDP